jgi:protein-disulfide isomerase
MLRRILIPLLFLASILAACAGSTSSQSGTSVVPTAPEQVAQAPTQPVQATSSSSTETPAAPPGCTVISPQPTPGPTQQSVFPPVSDKDWVQGPSTAAITLVEYGDFQ